MATVDELLSPIGDESPTGPDLRLVDGDVTFDELRTLVSAAAPADGDDAIEPDWRGAIRLCESTLQSQSKDLELITQLAAAWVQVDGAEGLERGLLLMQRSLETFWKEIHPGVDPDDGEITLALRARWLNWMDTPRGLVAAVKQSTMFTASGGRACSWTDYENSAMFDDPNLSADRREELTTAGVMGPSEWDAAVGAASPDSLGELASSLGRSYETIRAIAAFCREPFEAEDEDPPDFFNLLGVVESMRDYFAERGGPAAGSLEEPIGVPTATGDAVAGAPAAAPGVLSTRADAIRQLSEVGAFFRRTEPHSPISYLITRAVKWGSMPLDQLLKDVVRDDSVIEHIWETLGLDANADANDDDRDDDDD